MFPVSSQHPKWIHLLNPSLRRFPTSPIFPLSSVVITRPIHGGFENPRRLEFTFVSTPTLSRREIPHTFPVTSEVLPLIRIINSSLPHTYLRRPRIQCRCCRRSSPSRRRSDLGVFPMTMTDDLCSGTDGSQAGLAPGRYRACTTGELFRSLRRAAAVPKTSSLGH